ncbi:MAG: bifunctional adenosylcobinamide kinase/adenosylcobinamide-phosphate guanylyltransferase [Lachnospiraceae bacterium]|nr:bifunctional adenosylcobinamide kinase/adenosylcobinamide-phosphate guanylyltransferase [Lachnospiraceae bacterium]
MFQVVTGGSGSGKSAYAEEQILSMGKARRIYIATMFPFDQESFARIERHRVMRAEKQFDTIECYTGLKEIIIPEHANVLLECMSNLTANEMFQESGAKENTVLAICEGIQALLRQADNLVVVTNEIFSDGIVYEQETRTYQNYLGAMNQYMAGIADTVTEVVYGIPLTIKSGRNV